MSALIIRSGPEWKGEEELTFVSRVEELLTVLASLGSEFLERLDVDLIEDLADENRRQHRVGANKRRGRCSPWSFHRDREQQIRATSFLHRRDR